ncbi:desulfoferrodoxin [Candidatus Woesearchaeota archaeon]|nr:desulfoferrodoxin [Candidatus Woesearchaeota archaeon]
MTKLNESYKCGVCGNLVEVVHSSVGKLVCCGKPMELLVEQHDEERYEKHVPVVEVLKNSVKVKIGSLPHPMEPQHYIEWIEVLSEGKIYRQYLKPGDAPEATFPVLADKARAYCNIHGLWAT